MLETIRNLFGMEKTDYAQLIKEGAIIVDVRTKAEYKEGHIKGSINIPVDKLESSINSLKDKTKSIITCCASGMRSASAKKILESKGFTRVYNGGGWSSLQQKI